MLPSAKEVDRQFNGNHIIYFNWISIIPSAVLPQTVEARARPRNPQTASTQTAKIRGTGQRRIWPKLGNVRILLIQCRYTPGCDLHF
jgi:hypothetical protein